MSNNYTHYKSVSKTAFETIHTHGRLCYCTYCVLPSVIKPLMAAWLVQSDSYLCQRELRALSMSGKLVLFNSTHEARTSAVLSIEMWRWVPCVTMAAKVLLDYFLFFKMYHLLSERLLPPQHKLMGSSRFFTCGRVNGKWMELMAVKRLTIKALTLYLNGRQVVVFLCCRLFQYLSSGCNGDYLRRAVWSCWTHLGWPLLCVMYGATPYKHA